MANVSTRVDGAVVRRRKEILVSRIRVATWNVNSVRKRLKLLAQFASEASPDVICLQEIKCRDAEFPINDIKAMGFEHVMLNGQKGYHGVAVLSKWPLSGRQAIDFIGSGESRHLAVQVKTDNASAAPLLLHNFYVPAGGDEADPEVNKKFRDKLAYFEALTLWGKKQRRKKAARVMVVGDLNVAPLEQDVWSHKKMVKVVSHTPVEVELFERAKAAGGWEDVMRRFVPPEEKLYTWWSYRARDWQKANRGRRLDHAWVNAALAPNVTAVSVLRDMRGWEVPSDHVPVLIDLED